MSESKGEGEVERGGVGGSVVALVLKGNVAALIVGPTFVMGVVAGEVYTSSWIGSKHD